MPDKLRSLQETDLDLLVILALTLICYPVMTLGEGLLRIILGIIFLLIFPGYTMVTALFPGKNSLKPLERVAFTLVLSFALVALTGLVLNYTTWGITLMPIYLGVSILIVAFSGIAFIRRYKLPQEERFSLSLRFKTAKSGKSNKVDMALSICLAIVVVGAVSVCGYVITKPKPKEPFTNFYLLGADGMLEKYPKNLNLGDQAVVIVGLENHELQDIRYNIQVKLEGTEPQLIGPISLVDGEKWTTEVSLAPSIIGENQKVEFTLYKAEESTSYLALHLWLNVNE
jgi:uncharacterized membrane protein